ELQRLHRRGALVPARRPARRPLQPRGAHPRGGGAPIHAPAQPGAPRCGGDRRRARRRGRPQQPPGGLRAQPAVGGLLRRLRHRGAAPRRLRAWSFGTWLERVRLARLMRAVFVFERGGSPPPLRRRAPFPRGGRSFEEVERPVAGKASPPSS
ncbi:unnamed protein product, partial [Prorocentrum cordatum]